MPTSKQETQRQSILHLWNNGIRDAKEIHARTIIPLTTIYDNIRKLKKTGTIKHAGGNGRPKKITAGTWTICAQGSSLSTRTLANKLSQMSVHVSHVTIALTSATQNVSQGPPLC